MQKQFAAIALEDQETRQRIMKEAEERKAQLEREILEKQRQNERDLMLKKQDFEKAEEIKHLQQEANLAKTNFQEMQEQISQEKEAQAKMGETIGKAPEQVLAAGDVHKRALKAVMEYYLDGDEISSCTDINYPIGEGGILPSVRQLFSQNPSMRLNLFASKVVSSGGAGEKVEVGTGRKFHYWNASDLVTKKKNLVEKVLKRLLSKKIIGSIINPDLELCQMSLDEEEKVEWLAY